MDGLAINASWNPAASAGVNSALGLGVTYTGVEGLSVSYARSILTVTQLLTKVMKLQ